jgi:hypothetical protein
VGNYVEKIFLTSLIFSHFIHDLTLAALKQDIWPEEYGIYSTTFCAKTLTTKQVMGTKTKRKRAIKSPFWNGKFLY